MLQLTTRPISIEGITVYPDHSDPDQFWFLPGPVQLSRKPDGRAAFSFIKYKPAAVTGGAKGGGFLMFETDLRLARDLERRILSKLRSVSQGRPRLAAVPFDEGTVEVVALDLQGSGGTANSGSAGTFRAVEKILGATTPSLDATNTAAFSLSLSREGTTILEQAFEQGVAPVGVIYSLKYTGMRPALKVEIKADLKRVYDQFSVGLEAQVYFVRAGIDAAFEKLVQDGVIKIKVLDFTGEQDEKDKEQWALDFFKNDLLAKWFEPTLTHGQVVGGAPQAESLDKVRTRGDALRPPSTPAPAKPAAGATPAAPAAPSTPPTVGTGKGESGAGGVDIAPPAVAGAAGVNPLSGTGFPAQGDAPLPAALVGGGNPAATAAQGGALAAAGDASPAVVSLKVRVVHQEELKSLTLTYDRSEAVQRTYAPQGFFGLLVADLERAGHFVEVDLDDAFFRAFSVSVEPPGNFASIGLKSAHVALNYGDPDEPATVKHADFVFDAANSAPQSFQAFMGPNLETGYQTQVQFHFDPNSDWQAAKFSYELEAERTEDRTLVLNPHEQLGFLNVQVEPVRVDWGIVESIEVTLSYGSDEERLERTLLFVEGDAAQPWRVRTEDRTRREYSYSIRHRLKDGTVKEEGPFESRATLLPVEDPFPGALDIEFINVLDPTRTKQAFIDVEYDDPDNDYRRELRLKLEPGAADNPRVLLALIDPSRRSFRFRLTLIGIDNGMHRGAFVETEETLLAVGEPAPAG